MHCCIHGRNLSGPPREAPVILSALPIVITPASSVLFIDFRHYKQSHSLKTGITMIIFILIMKKPEYAVLEMPALQQVPHC